MTEIILIVLYIGHVFLSRRLCKLAYKNGVKHVSYYWWWSWFIPLGGIIWAFLDYMSSLPPEPPSKKNNDRNWFTGRDW